MKKSHAIVLGFSLILIVFGGIGYLLFKGSSFFISAIDGNNSNQNYSHITESYYLLKTERTICYFEEDSFTRLILSVDSLNWNDSIITGYSNKQYFLISTKSKKIEYFNSKELLINSVVFIPIQNSGELPSLSN